MKSRVDVDGTCRLVLDSGHVLIFKKTFYIPGFIRNLISVSKFIPCGYTFIFEDSYIKLLYKSHMVGTHLLSDGLFYINLNINSHTVLNVRMK
jgi:hypothetical protein